MINETALLVWFLTLYINFKWFAQGQKKKMCVYCYMLKKSRVGRSAIIFFFFFFTIGQTGNSRSRFLNPIPVYHFRIPVSRHLFWSCFMRVTQFFYLLCSQFRQKDSGWINKTLLLIKQQKWLSEFCVKIDRVASKN